MHPLCQFQIVVCHKCSTTLYPLLKTAWPTMIKRYWQFSNERTLRKLIYRPIHNCCSPWETKSVSRAPIKLANTKTHKSLLSWIDGLNQPNEHDFSSTWAPAESLTAVLNPSRTEQFVQVYTLIEWLVNIRPHQSEQMKFSWTGYIFYDIINVIASMTTWYPCSRIQYHTQNSSQRRRDRNCCNIIRLHLSRNVLQLIARHEYTSRKCMSHYEHNWIFTDNYSIIWR